MFGQTKPLFGSNITNTFGQATTFGQSTNLFGSTNTQQPSQSIFGSSASNSVFGSSTFQSNGSTVSFNPPISSDTIQRSGQTTTVSTKHMCYSAMKDFQTKSLEEIRLEDYMANRKVPANKTGGSMFGTSTPNAFGSANASQQSSSIFGSSAQATAPSIFGSNQQNASQTSNIFGSKPLFGSSTQQSNISTNLFGTSSTGFGTSTASTGFGAFGQTNTTSSASSVFGSKPLFGSSGTTNLFGASQTQQPASTGGIFGGQTSTFGQSNINSGSSLFGSTVKPTGFTFGQSTTQQSSPFGQTNNTSGGLFGSKPTTLGGTGSIFGSPTTSTQQPVASGGLFGTPNSLTKPTGFSFSSTTSAPTAGNTFTFGQTTASPGSIFGSNSINNQNKPLFGTTTTSSSGFSFGNTTQTGTAGSLFGASTATANKPGPLTFGQSTSGTLFGTNTGLSGSAGTLFGSVGTSPAAGSLFSTNTNSTLNKPFGSTFGSTTGFGSTTFGSNQPAGSSLFGSSTSGSCLGSTGFGGSGFSNTFASNQTTTGPTVNNATEQLAQHVRAQQHVLNLIRTMPYGNLYRHINAPESNSSLSPSQPDQNSVSANNGNQAATKAIVNALVERNRPSYPAIFAQNVRASTRNQRVLPVDRAKLFSGLDEEDEPKNKQKGLNGDFFKSLTPCGEPNNLFCVRKDDWKKLVLPENLRKSIIERSVSQKDPPKSFTDNTLSTNVLPESSVCGDMIPHTRLSSGDKIVSPSIVDNQVPSVHQSTDVSSPKSLEKSPVQQVNNPSGVKLSKPGYYMLPTLENLSDYINKHGRCVVDDLVIGRKSYGHILFPGHTDITGVDLDEIVYIKRGEVVIYPDDDNKPPIGYGLNRRAEITLDGLWPKDRATRELITQPDVTTAAKFGEKLEKATCKMNANFIEYRAETGSWVFEVKHFSKYRYDDESDEEEIISQQTLSQSQFNPKLKTSSKVVPTADQPVLEESPNYYLAKARDTLLSKAPTNTLFDKLENDGGQSLWSKQLTSHNFLSSSQNNFFENQCNMELDDTQTLERRTLLFRDEDDQMDLKINRISQSLSASSDEDMPFLENELIFSDEPSRGIKGKQIHKTFIEPVPVLIENEGEALNHRAFKVSDLSAMKIPVALKQTILEQGRDFKYSLAINQQYDIDIKEEAHRCLEAESRRNLSRLFVDVSFSRGDGIRPSWAMLRHRHGQGPSLDSQIRLVKTQEASGYKIEAVTDQSPLQAIDEALMNCALLTSSSTLDIEESEKEFGPNEDFAPLWEPVPNINEPNEQNSWLVLNSYLNVLDLKKMIDDEDSELIFRRSRMRSIFTLCSALWGDLNRPRSDENIEMIAMNPRTNESNNKSKWFANDHLVKIARKQAVSTWIRSESFHWLKHRLRSLEVWNLVNSNVNKESTDNIELIRQGISPPFTRIAGSTGVTERHYEAIFCCLCAGQVELASRLALVFSMPALASLLSQASAGDPVIRAMLKGQLEFWIETETINRIPIALLKVYGLIAGLISLPLELVEDQSRKPRSLNIFTGISWVQTFGMFMWYIMDWQSSLQVCLSAYSQAWHESAQEGNGITPPVPPTKSQIIHHQFPQLSRFFLLDQNALKSKNWPRDTCYHLLQLFCCPDHKLDRTLDPLGLFLLESCENTSEPLEPNALLDWSVVWHLWRILNSFNLTKSLNRHVTSRLHSEFASQLESVGLWEWSLFVQAHEISALHRCCAMKSCISRHAFLTHPHPHARFAVRQFLKDQHSLPVYAAIDPAPHFTSAEEFIINQVKVPSRWIHESKAIFAGSLMSRFSFNKLTGMLDENLAGTIAEESRFAELNEDESIVTSKKESQSLLSCLLASHWFHAGHYSIAHLVCLQHILPQLIFHVPIGFTSEARIRLPGLSSKAEADLLVQSELSEPEVLGQLLSIILEPFAQLPITHMPKTFPEGGGIYYAFGALLRLTSRLTKLSIKRYENFDPQSKEIEEEEHRAIAALRLELGKMCDHLQTMWTPDLLSKVVKIEMALVSSRLLTNFVMDTLSNKNEQNQFESEYPLALTLNALHQMLRLIIQLGLPKDFRDRESRSLSALRLSIESLMTNEVSAF